MRYRPQLLTRAHYTRGPFTHLPATWRPPRAPAWPVRVAPLSRVSATCAPHGPLGLCHVASVPRRTRRRSRAPHQPLPGPAHHVSTCGKLTPFFCYFNSEINLKIHLKIRRNSEKGLKLQKFIFLKIQLLLISNFLYWITNSFLFNIMSFKIYLERRNQDDL